MNKNELCTKLRTKIDGINTLRLNNYKNRLKMSTINHSRKRAKNNII